MRDVWTILMTIGLGVGAPAQPPDWKAIEAEALQTLQRYVRINTSNPPGDVTRPRTSSPACSNARASRSSATSRRPAARSCWRG